jgi:hypothetical protein
MTFKYEQIAPISPRKDLRTYTDAQVSFTGVTNFDSATGKLIPYQTLDGQWWLKAHLQVNTTALVTSVIFKIDGVDFSEPADNANNPFWTGTAVNDQGNAGCVYIRNVAGGGSANQITLGDFSSSSNDYTVQFEAPLDSKPTWATSGDAINTLVEDNLKKWTAHSPTDGNGFGTFSNQNVEYKRVDDSLIMRGFLTLGTVAASEARIPLPTGLTIGGTGSADTIPTGVLFPDVGRDDSFHLLATKGDTYLNVGLSIQTGSSPNPLTPINGNSGFNSSERIAFETGPIPITQWAGSQNSLVGFSDATSDKSGLVKKNKYVFAYDTSGYNSNQTGLLLKSNIPAGTYRLTVGARLIQGEEDENAFITPQINGSNITHGDNDFKVGVVTDTGVSGDTTSVYEFQSTIIVTMSSVANSLELDLTIGSTASLVDNPYYYLEKLENMEDAGSDWD